MSLRDALRRVQAWGQGRPLPRGKALPWPEVADENTLILAFVRMAGENLPWGIAYGAPTDSEPQVVSVPDPRKVDDVIAMLVAFAPTLLAHMPHPEHRPEAEGDEEPGELFLPLRQLWLPGGSHLDMLHFLDYRLTPARKAEREVLAVIHPLGRACGWLFREAHRPAQFRVMDATAALKKAFDVPAEDLRQQHLGFLMAWLTTEGSREARAQAARLAERESVATTMSPEFEARELRRPLERWAAAEDRGEDAASAREALAALLRVELVRRWQLTRDARAFLRADPRGSNPCLNAVIALARDEFRSRYLYYEARDQAPDGAERERGYTSPETDGKPSVAASRFFTHNYAEALANDELIHGDEELALAAIENGDAVCGLVTAVVDEGPGRKQIPVWTLRAPMTGVMRLRRGSKVCVLGLKGRDGVVRDLRVEDGQRVFTVVIQGWKRARDGHPAAVDAEALVGVRLTLVAAGAAEFERSKSFKVHRSDAPGAWLTHATPPPRPDAALEVRRDLLALVRELEGRR